jgi:hypothetical protein
LVKQQQQASLTEGATEEAQAPPAVTPEAEPLSEVSPSEPEMPMAVKEEGAKEEGSGGAKVVVVAKAVKKLMKDEERLTGKSSLGTYESSCYEARKRAWNSCGSDERLPCPCANPLSLLLLL